MASSTIDGYAARRADGEKKRAQIGLQMANMISAPGSQPASRAGVEQERRNFSENNDGLTGPHTHRGVFNEGKGNPAMPPRR